MAPPLPDASHPSKRTRRGAQAAVALETTQSQAQRGAGVPGPPRGALPPRAAQLLRQVEFVEPAHDRSCQAASARASSLLVRKRDWIARFPERLCKTTLRLLARCEMPSIAPMATESNVSRLGLLRPHKPRVSWAFRSAPCVRWADMGYLRAYRTPGGQRRFQCGSDRGVCDSLEQRGHARPPTRPERAGVLKRHKTSCAPGPRHAARPGIPPYRIASSPQLMRPWAGSTGSRLSSCVGCGSARTGLATRRSTIEFLVEVGPIGVADSRRHGRPAPRPGLHVAPYDACPRLATAPSAPRMRRRASVGPSAVSVS
jgi:hypothetical protein